MAKKTVCDICNGVILDGENCGTRNPIFSFPYNTDGGVVHVTTKVRIEGVNEPDVCLPCLKRVVAEA